MKFSNLLKFLCLSVPLCAAEQEKRLANIFNECTKPGVVALTLDDGPHSEFTPKVLDLLKANNVKATFFLNGNNYGSDIENSDVTKSIIKRQIAEGHDVGSHTFFHKNCFAAYEDGTLKENIERIQKGIENVVHRTPRFFRPPQGEGGFSEEYCRRINVPYDPRTEIIRGILAGDGYRYGPYYDTYDYDIILWNGDPEDWNCDGTNLTVKDAIDSLDRTMGPAVADPSKNSFIVLAHDVSEYSVTTIIPEMIKHIKSLGYTFVPLSECIGRKPYKETKSYISDHEEEIKAAEPDTTSENVSSAEPAVEQAPAQEVAAAPDNAAAAPEVAADAAPEVDTAQEVDPAPIDAAATAPETANSQDKSVAQKNSDMVINDRGADIDDTSSTEKLSVMTLSSILLYCIIAFLTYY